MGKDSQNVDQLLGGTPEERITGWLNLELDQNGRPKAGVSFAFPILRRAATAKSVNSRTG